MSDKPSFRELIESYGQSQLAAWQATYNRALAGHVDSLVEHQLQAADFLLAQRDNELLLLVEEV